MLEKEKQELVELMSELFRRLYKISPMASKIWATLVMQSNKEGFTFEELVTYFHASKSTISSNLNVLLNLEVIYYETREGKRRKYFKSYSFTKRFNESLENIRYEKAFTQRVINYAQQAQVDDEQYTQKLQNLQLLINYLSEMEALTINFLKKINTTP